MRPNKGVRTVSNNFKDKEPQGWPEQADVVSIYATVGEFSLIEIYSIYNISIHRLCNMVYTAYTNAFETYFILSGLYFPSSPKYGFLVYSKLH